MSKTLLALLFALISLPSMATPEEGDTVLIEQAARATLLVRTELVHGFTMDDADAPLFWRGSAFVVNKEKGWIVTNAHIAGYGPTNLHGRFLEQKEFSPLRRIYVDSLHDIAVLGIDPKSIPANTKQLDLECDYSLRRGEAIFAIGHPNGQDFTSTKGILSGSKNLHLDGDFYTTDLIIEGGNSGGPVTRIASGKVIGISTSGYEGSNIGHLTKSRDICRIMDSLEAGKSPARPYLGFQALIVDKEHSAFVANVIDPDSPLRFMDEILSWNGNTWNPAQDGDLPDQMRGYTRSSVTLTVRRKGEELDLEVPVKAGISQHERKWVFFSGITLTESPHIDAKDLLPPKPGSVITVQSVDPSYDDVLDLEFMAYSEIISLNETPITSLEQAYGILSASAESGEKVRVIARNMDYNPEAYMHYFQHSITVEDLEKSD
jgi:S1-C subfamily serine protease